jgi:uncharacterized iron-regulated membrane protein
VVGLVPGLLAITGGVMWLERQRRRPSRRRSPPDPAHESA